MLFPSAVRCLADHLFRYVPKYFVWNEESGCPTLTDAGRAALEEELKEEAAHPLEQ